MKATQNTIERKDIDLEALANFKDIAAKNKANKDYVDAAVKKLSSGTGHPKSAASEADLKAIMGWVMTL